MKIKKKDIVEEFLLAFDVYTDGSIAKSHQMMQKGEDRFWLLCRLVSHIPYAFPVTVDLMDLTQRKQYIKNLLTGEYDWNG